MSAVAAPGAGRARLLGDLVKYGLASVLALACDLAVLALGVRVIGLGPLTAAALGFLSGLAVIYALSVRHVFSDRRSVPVRAEIAGFLATGVAGLLLTEALMYLFVDRLGLAVLLSKVPTSGLVFLFNFATRRALLFSRRGSR